MAAPNWRQEREASYQRRGKPMSVRLEPEQRELIEKAARAEYEKTRGDESLPWHMRRWQAKSVGEAMRDAAIAWARGVLEAGNTGRAGAGGNTGAAAKKKKLAAVRR